MRKVNCEIEVMVKVDLNGATIQDFVDECSYDFVDTTTHACVEDTNLNDYKRINPDGILMTFGVLVTTDSGVEFSEVVNEMHYNIEDGTGQALIMETEMQDYRVTDSR